MKGMPVYQIHLFIAPSSLPWILSLGFSALQVQKASPIFAVPRWLAHWLEPEGKRRKRRTPQVNPVRDQISHRMQGSTATPVEEKLEMEEAGGAIRTCQGLSQSNPIGITPHHAPTIAPTTGYSRARSVSVRGLFKLWSMRGGDEAVSTHLNSANILTHVNLSTTSACPSLNMAMEGDPRTRAVGK